MTWDDIYYAKYQRQTGLYGNDLRNADPVFLRVGHGGRLYVGAMGKRGGQCGNIQDDFTSVQYPNWRHDWIPEWYQIKPRRND
ncbi:hypothetical protein UFOVP79_8 [uncultured Caudovirales phage]|uniref:Uncharacterized protein n=1 Tax=uncultured Caudovirales phage TaxID=2100421 RepID=A0A6J5L288_9CAUD|nr:hypothetical protein UFOVP79_8 [uncultured Caudovirales phage]